MNAALRAGRSLRAGVALGCCAAARAGCARAGRSRSATRCPPSFEKTAGGICELRTLYQFYDSLEDRGVGGTRTALPPHRDGFTPQQIDLGRYLFFDPLLSGDGTLSCASCHRPDRGLADGRPRSIGIHGEDAGRAAPTLWNVAFLQALLLGRARRLARGAGRGAAVLAARDGQRRRRACSRA